MLPPLPIAIRLLLVLALLLPTISPTQAASPGRPSTSSTLASTLTSVFASTSALTSASPFVSPLPPPPPPVVPLALTLDADPFWAEPGDVVTFTVTAHNLGPTPLIGLALADTLPDGLRYVAGSAAGFTYAPDAKQLTWQPAEVAAGATITGRFQARAQGLALGDTVTNTVTATGVGLTAPISANATVDVVSPRNNEVWATPEQGGLLRSRDDRVLLRVPPGAVRGRTRFTYAPVTDAPHPPPGLRFAFRLEAEDERGQAVRQFPAALELTMAASPDQDSLRLYYFEETTQRWTRIPTARLPHRPDWRARLEHLTLFAGASGEDPVMPSGMPSIRGIQSDLFTGAATVNYEIPLPAGAGGFAPHLSLQFNSRQRADSSGATSVLGTGWNLSVDSWVATGWFLIGDGSKPTIWHIDGVSYTEVGDLSQGGTFREAPDWRIIRGNGDSRDAYAPDGRRYHFEPAFHDVKVSGSSTSWVTAKWLLAWMTDAVGNRITFHYAKPLPIDPANVEDFASDYYEPLLDTTLGKRSIRLWRDLDYGGVGNNWHKYLFQNPLTGFAYNTTGAPDKTQVEFIYDGELRSDFPRATSADPCDPDNDATTGQTDTWTYAAAGVVQNADGLTVGFTDVIETLPASLVSGSSVYHRFLAGQDDNDSRRGKEQEQRTERNGVKLAQVIRDWQGTTTGVLGGVKLAYLNWEERRVYDVTGSSYQAQRTQYYYDLDAEHNGAVQYGNPTRILEYRDAGMTLYRTTERWYKPRAFDGNFYQAHRLAQEKLWSGPIGGSCQGQTRYIYDTTGLAAWQTPPTHGLLREVWRAQACDSANPSDWVRQTAYDYDAWGNRTMETATNGATTTTSYDPTLHTYPLNVTVQPGAGGGATLTTGYKYYGINAAAGGQGLFGQLQSVTDPNGAITRYRYDAWGRVTEIRRPVVDPAGYTPPCSGFACAATEVYAYVDAPAPFTIYHAVRKDAQPDSVATASYRQDWTFYDGLGQVIQTQAEGATPAQGVLVSTKYNALGLVISQTVPYFGTANGSYQPLNAWAGKTTATLYDALGRVTKVLAPDNTWVDTVYNGRQTAVVDALRHQTIREVDAFGRLVSVKQ